MNTGNLVNLMPYAEQTKEINIKDKLLCMPWFLLNRMVLKQGLSERCALDRLRVLEERQVLPKILTKLIYLQLILVFRLRYMAHFYYGEENDKLNLVSSDYFLNVQLVETLNCFRIGVMPTLYSILSKEKVFDFENMDLSNLKRVIPAISLIADEYLSKKDFIGVVEHYNMVLDMVLSVTRNEEKVFVYLNLV